MDPDLERRLTEEVIYLHALWRQGPPRNPKPKPNRSVDAQISIRNPLTTRKRPGEQKVRKREKKKSRPEPPQDSGPEWPCPEPVENQASTSSGWPAIEPSSTTAVHTISSEERAKLAALQLQYKEFEACREFFARNADSGSDDEGAGDDEPGDDGDNNESEESEEYKYFLKLFVENSDLRSYYERNSEAGFFCCLVCGGIGKKNSGKKFKSCVGLVQHSIAISKTKKRRAHRAFGQVICRVFGWDIDRLPMIVLKGEPLARSLADPGNSKVQPEENCVANVHHPSVQNENTTSLNDNNSQKNEEISITDYKNNMNSVDGNEHGLEEERTAEDPHSNAKDLISVTECPMLKLHSASAKCVVSADEQSRYNMMQVLQSTLEACKEFFAGSSPSKRDSDGSGDDLPDGDGLEECEEFKFFLKLFAENEDLRKYHETKYECGEFCCLVCVGTGKRVLKRFKTCRSLLQHSTSMVKTKKKLAHRAYSSVICKVLGWDVEKLPTIVLKGEPLGRSLAKSGTPKDGCVGNTVANLSDLDALIENEPTKVNNGEAVLKNESDVNCGPHNS